MIVQTAGLWPLDELYNYYVFLPCNDVLHCSTLEGCRPESLSPTNVIDGWLRRIVTPSGLIASFSCIVGFMVSLGPR